MALHGGGHLELKQMHRGNFRGLFGIRLAKYPGIIPKKSAFCNFIPGSCVFVTNVLALFRCWNLTSADRPRAEMVNLVLLNYGLVFFVHLNLEFLT